MLTESSTAPGILRIIAQYVDRVTETLLQKICDKFWIWVLSNVAKSRVTELVLSWIITDVFWFMRLGLCVSVSNIHGVHKALSPI